MKCDDIKLLLDEYLEGSLSAGDTALVKEHLKKCPDCREELQFLKKYLKKTESFPVLKAPDDFLENIHRRIEGPGRSSLASKLFFPLKIKVPLEAAALLALAVTGLVIFKPFSPDMIAYKAEEAGRPSAMEDEVAARGDSAVSVREKQSPVMERALKKERHPSADTRVAASRSDDMVASELSDADQLPREKTTTSAGERTEITLYLKQSSSAGSESAANKSYQAKELDREEEPRVASRRSQDFEKKEKADLEGIKVSAPSGSGQASIDGIAGLARSMGGTIIKKTADGNQVIVEIPRSNYTRFMKGLRGNWNVMKQYPAEVPARARKVQFNINLQN